LTSENEKHEQTNLLLENTRLYKKLLGLQTVVSFIYICLFVFFIWGALYIANLVDSSILTIVFTAMLAVLYFCVSWLVSLPFRIMLFNLSTKAGLLHQDYSSWFKDWVKVLLINIIVVVPFMAIAPVLIIEFLKPDTSFLTGFLIIFILMLGMIIIKLLQRYLSALYIHGVSRLEEGPKYDYLKLRFTSMNVPLYPIYVLNISKKASWANALAIGFKNLGLIYTSDKLVDDLTEDQFVAIMLHETAHLENNDILKRAGMFIALMLLLLLNLIALDYADYAVLSWYPFILILFVLFMVYQFPIIVKQQEKRADKYSKTKLKNGSHLAEALQYLYKVNRIPDNADEKKSGVRFHSHPTLKERVSLLLEEEYKGLNDEF
jgi:Zn-dependent protease with chaperone function